MRTATLVMAVVVLAAPHPAIGNPPVDQGEPPPLQEQRADQDKAGKQPRGRAGERSPQRDRRRAAATQPIDKRLDPKHHRQQRPWTRLLKGIELSEDQKQVLRQTTIQARQKHQTWRRARRTWQEENRQTIQNLRRQMSEARTSKDRQRTAAVHRKLRALFASTPKPPAIMNGIRQVLSEEQHARFDENRRSLHMRQGHRLGARRHGEPRGKKDRRHRTPGRDRHGAGRAPDTDRHRKDAGKSNGNDDQLDL